MASGDFLDLAEWAARTARFDTSATSDMVLAKQAVNDAYMTSCATGDRWKFLINEGQWTTTAGSDVYTYAAIASALTLTGAVIEQIEALTDDAEGYVFTRSTWEDLERLTQSTQDDPRGNVIYWAQWNERIRLYPVPDATYTIGILYRVTPSEMTANTDLPLIPAAWRRRLLIPPAAAQLIRTEGGLEAQAEASRLMEQYERDMVRFRTAYSAATGTGNFRLKSLGFDAMEPAADSTQAGFSLWGR